MCLIHNFRDGSFSIHNPRFPLMSLFSKIASFGISICMMPPAASGALVRGYVATFAPDGTLISWFDVGVVGQQSVESVDSFFAKGVSPHDITFDIMRVER